MQAHVTETQVWPRIWTQILNREVIRALSVDLFLSFELLDFDFTFIEMAYPTFKK
jgi:hypothetical protein